jgi:hypothetical protein
MTARDTLPAAKPWRAAMWSDEEIKTAAQVLEQHLNAVAGVDGSVWLLNPCAATRAALNAVPRRRPEETTALLTLARLAGEYCEHNCFDPQCDLEGCSCEWAERTLGLKALTDTTEERDG